MNYISAHYKDMSQLSLTGAEIKVLDEVQVYKRYLTVWSRKTQYPDGRITEWDVVGHGIPNPAFAVVFPYNSNTVNTLLLISQKTTTLIREYSQGTNECVLVG